MLHYGHLVRILHCCTSQAMTEALSSMDLTSAQGHLMGFLAHSGKALCARDIEEAFHLSHPTVSGLLARLEKKEFLEFIHEKLYSYPGDCHARKANWLAMTGNSPNSQFNGLRKPISTKF